MKISPPCDLVNFSPRFISSEYLSILTRGLILSATMKYFASLFNVCYHNKSILDNNVSPETKKISPITPITIRVKPTIAGIILNIILIYFILIYYKFLRNRKWHFFTRK